MFLPCNKELLVLIVKEEECFSATDVSAPKCMPIDKQLLNDSSSLESSLNIVAVTVDYCYMF